MSFKSESENCCDPTVHYLREEVSDDAIFLVSLKKITYTITPVCHEVNGSGTEPCIKGSQHLVYTIKAGTLERLIDSFVQRELDTIDSCHLNIFLLTYRTFTDPLKLLNALQNRFLHIVHSTEHKESYRLTYTTAIKTFLNLWLESQNLEDFNVPPEFAALELMLSMVHQWHEMTHKSNLKEGLDALRNRILAILDRFHTEYTVNEKLYREVAVDAFIQNRDMVPEKTSLSDSGVNDMSPRLSRREISFEQLDVVTVAEQLTLIDKELFLRVVPHQCLSRVRGQPAPTVDATIQHFNKVVNAVTSTVLKPTALTTAQRAAILQRWIEIASELRSLKNFSTLTAVISGLQSHEIYRLRRCWKHLDRMCPTLVQKYNELAKLVSAENNQELGRKVLNDEGAAKYSEADKKQSVKTGFSLFGRRSSTKQQRQTVLVGTIPYIGTFLTDLTMIDHAHPDLREGLINFEKSRKEFYSLCSISIFQSSAKNYSISRNELFHIWFSNISLMDPSEANARSHEIFSGHELSLKRDNSDCSHGGGDLETSLGTGPTCSLSSGMEDSASLSSAHSSTADEHNRNSSRSSIGPPPDSPQVTSLSRLSQPNFLIIKMRLNLDHLDSAELVGVNYKTIMIRNTQKVNDVLKDTLDKFNIVENVDNFCVYRVYSDGREFLIPDKSNVYYALGGGSSVEDITCDIRLRDMKDRLCASMKVKESDRPSRGHARTLSIT